MQILTIRIWNRMLGMNCFLHLPVDLRILSTTSAVRVLYLFSKRVKGWSWSKSVASPYRLSWPPIAYPRLSSPPRRVKGRQVKGLSWSKSVASPHRLPSLPIAFQSSEGLVAEEIASPPVAPCRQAPYHLPSPLVASCHLLLASRQVQGSAAEHIGRR